MKNVEFWKPIIISLAFTPPALIVGLISAGAGHGDYLVAKILFPYTMLSTALYDSITDLFFAAAFVQFPLYGVILAFAGERRRFYSFAFLLALIHTSTVALCFVIGSKNFSG